jgi:DNA-binding HxlR family transcriptional regulator
MTRYDHDIDDLIISYLYKNDKANFSQLLLQVGQLHKATSKKVLSSHLKKLEENRIILRDKERPGVDRFSYLTKLARQQVSLGIPVQVKSKRTQGILFG